MNKYEGFFLLDNREAKADWDALEKHVHGYLEKYGCKLHLSTKWGERKLAYEIGRHRRGTYLLTYFEADPQQLAELRHDIGISSEKIIRHMFLHIEEFPEKPILEESEEAARRAEAEEKAEAEKKPEEKKAEGDAAPATEEKPEEKKEDKPEAKAEEAAPAAAETETPATSDDNPADAVAEGTEKEAPLS